MSSCLEPIGIGGACATSIIDTEHCRRASTWNVFLATTGGQDGPTTIAAFCCALQCLVASIFEILLQHGDSWCNWQQLEQDWPELAMVETQIVEKLKISILFSKQVSVQFQQLCYTLLHTQVKAAASVAIGLVLCASTEQLLLWCCTSKSSSSRNQTAPTRTTTSSRSKIETSLTLWRQWWWKSLETKMRLCFQTPCTAIAVRALTLHRR